MITFPNAKINLGLYVLSRRPDNYHNLSTLFYPVGWSDALEVVLSDEGEGCRLHTSGIVIDGDTQNNLVAKAYRLLAADYPLPPVDAYLHKNIPFGAGLGGGSADAAYMLRLLRDLCSLPLDDDTLARYASRLGTDCPFFIYNRPMLAEGTGDLLSPADLSLKGYYLVLVKPAVSVSTAEAYASIVPAIPPVALPEIIKRPITEWKELLVNDFEKSIFPKYPQLAELKQQLYNQGAVYASMSGSGSTIFGLFENLPEDILETFPHCQMWTGECGC